MRNDVKKISIFFIAIFLLTFVTSCNSSNAGIAPPSPDSSNSTEAGLAADTSSGINTPARLPAANNKKPISPLTIIIIVIAIIVAALLGMPVMAHMSTKREEEEGLDAQGEQELQMEPEKNQETQPHSKPVQFHAFWNKHIYPEVWQTLLVYISSGHNGLIGVSNDFERRKTAPSEQYEDSSSMSGEPIQRGTEITVIPELKNFRFNPPMAKVLFLEDWHCIEFRMQASLGSKFQPNEMVEGQISFYVGPLLIGANELYVIMMDTESSKLDQAADQIRYPVRNSTSPYRAIFVSYSHNDAFIVDKLELAYKALGDEYLRDILILRGGEEWNPALLKKIDQADVFQLCWSEASKQSTYVEQEWRHALAVNRQNFIRPVYWQKPMPEPPPELSKIHFAFVDMKENI
jgi:hypothetical protein